MNFWNFIDEKLEQKYQHNHIWCRILGAFQKLNFHSSYPLKYSEPMYEIFITISVVFTLIVENILSPQTSQMKGYNKNTNMACLRPDFRSMHKVGLPFLISPKIWKSNILNLYQIINRISHQYGQFINS